MKEKVVKWECHFERIREYPDCFQDCPDTSECKMKDSWKEIKPLTPYIGLDGKIVCNFEVCPLKKNVNLLDALKMVRKIIRNSREAPNVLDTIDWTAMKAIHDYLENKSPHMEGK